MSSAEFMELPAELQLQYTTPKHHFFNYVSRKIVNVSESIEAERKFILRFKEGDKVDQRHASNMIRDFILRENLNKEDVTFICLPASTVSKQIIRYRKFMDNVCRRCHINNGYNLVSVTSDRSEVHTGGSRLIKNYLISPDVAGKKVILFDDVETTGISFATFAAELERTGAQVIQGLFLAEAASL